MLIQGISYLHFNFKPNRFSSYGIILRSKRERELEVKLIFKMLKWEQYRNPMIVRISYDDVFVVSKTESMRRVELALSSTKLTKLESNMHWCSLVSAHEWCRRGH